MTLRIPNEGEGVALSIKLNKTAGENLRLRLYGNNVTPADTDVLSTYTELTGAGYASVLLTASSWVITEGSPTTATYPEITFTFTGSVPNVYGYYVTGETSNKVRWAERFSDGPYSTITAGDKIKINLVITQQDTLD